MSLTGSKELKQWHWGAQSPQPSSSITAATNPLSHINFKYCAIEIVFMCMDKAFDSDLCDHSVPDAFNGNSKTLVPSNEGNHQRQEYQLLNYLSLILLPNVIF